MKNLIPPFLKKLDKYLLLNYPLVWVSRIHYVLFIGLIMSVFSAIVGAAIPLNINHMQDLGLWYFLFTLLAVVAFCFWIYRNVTFNIEKKFGKRNWTDEYKVFILNFTCVLIFFSFPFLFTGIYNYRIAHTFTDEEFVDDINKMNIGETYIISNLNDYQEYYDSVKQNYSYDLKKRVSFTTHTPWEMQDDTAKHTQLLSTYRLQNIYSQPHTEQEIKFYIKSYIDVYRKYEVNTDEWNVSEDSLYHRYIYLLKKSPMNSQEFSYTNYNTYDLQGVFSNIARAKYRTLFIWNADFLHAIFYTCFYLSLLIMLFKMVSWKQFLITLLSFIIIPIILFIVSQLMPYSGYSSRDNTYIALMLLTFAVAFVFTILGIAQTKRFNAFRNICSQIVYLGMPVLPLVIVIVCKSYFYDYGYDSSYDYTTTTEIAAPEPIAAVAVVDSAKPLVVNDSTLTDTAFANMVAVNVAAANTEYTNTYYQSPEDIYRQLERQYWDRFYENCILIAMYGGLALYLLVVMPLMKQLFIKQLALPRKS